MHPANLGFPRNPSLASLPLFFTVCSVPRAPARQMVVRLILCPCLEGARSREPARPPGYAMLYHTMKDVQFEYLAGTKA